MSAPLGQFTPPTDAYTRALAQQTAVALGGEQYGHQSNVTPQLRTAKIVSNDGGSPPTCTVTWDEGVTSVAGIRYMSPYVPGNNDIVFTVGMDGIQWVVGKFLAGSPIACHVSRYTRTSTTTLGNGATATITWQSKDSTGLSEPSGDINGSLTDTFTIPFDAWWHIEAHITWDTGSDNGIGLRIETSASRLAQNIVGGAVLIDPHLSVACDRFLAASTAVKIRWANATGGTRTLQADGTTSPCYVTLRSLPIHVSGVA